MGAKTSKSEAEEADTSEDRPTDDQTSDNTQLRRTGQRGESGVPQAQQQLFRTTSQSRPSQLAKVASTPMCERATRKTPMPPIAENVFNPSVCLETGRRATRSPSAPVHRPDAPAALPSTTKKKDKLYEQMGTMKLHEEASSTSLIPANAATNWRNGSISAACRESVSTPAPSPAPNKYSLATCGCSPSDVDDFGTYVSPLVAPLESRSKSKASPHVARRMRVLYSYSAGQRQHLSARQGELVTLLERSDKYRGWALMRAADAANGFFQLNYVVEEVDEPESHTAFMQVDRREAERLLLYPGGALGAFLVRPHCDARTRTLSVLQRREKEGARQRPKLNCVKHYIISCTTQANGKHEYSVANVTRPSFQVSYFLQVLSIITCCFVYFLIYVLK